MPSTLARKRGFANGAQRFAKRAPRFLRVLFLVVLGACVAAIAGPFGTGMIEPLPRLGFWLALALFNFAKWEAWFLILRKRGMQWRKILLLGFPALLLPLPLEVDLGLRLFAGIEATNHLGVLLRGGALAGLWAVAVLMLPFGTRGFGQAPLPRFRGTAIPLDQIAAIVAEDHYIHLHLADGSAAMLHMRFGDALDALEDWPGEQVGRGAWVADRYRATASYRNRRWFLRAGAGIEVPISRSRVTALREKGWLARD